MPAVERYSKRVTAGLLAHEFDKDKMQGKASALRAARPVDGGYPVRGAVGGLAVPGQITARANDADSSPSILVQCLVRRITLIGELSPGERQKLLVIANLCPVHKSLTSRIDIQTDLVDPSV